MTLKNRRIAVVGSNAFSAASFIDLLLEDESNSVLGISRSPEYPDCMLAYKRHHAADFHFAQLDLNLDFVQVMEILDDFKPNYVACFAAQGEVRASFDHPDHHYLTNALAIVNLTNALRQRSYLDRYLQISTPEVYGSIPSAAEENAAFDPSSPYAASKGAADLFINSMVKTFGFPAVTIRATNVYGPHQQLYRIIPRTAIYIKLGRKIPLHGGGRAVKSYINIRDVSEGEYAAMLYGDIGKTYHLSPDGSGISIREVVQTVCDVMGVRLEDHVEITDDRLGQDAAYVLSSEKARNELGWKPGVSFQSGVEQVVSWIDRDWHAIKALPLDYIHKP